MKIIDKAKEVLSKSTKKNPFLTGALILAIAGIICRFLGVILRIPLTNIVGNFGMGLYQMVFPLYALLLIVSSAGMPVAISKMVARTKVDGDAAAGKKILLNSFVLLGAIGLAVSALFVIFSYKIAAFQGNKDVGIIYIAIAPSVFLVCLISALRGYFQGLQNMIPTAASQIIEQLVKIAAGITLAVILRQNSVVMAVFGAILAVTISETAALAFLILVYLKNRNKIKPTAGKESENQKQVEKIEHNPLRAGLDKKLMWQILKISAPITLMASIFPLILVFDSLVIINLLKSGGESQQTATQLFGIQSGAVHTLINLPAVIGVALGTAVVPTVSSLLKQQKQDELRTKCALAIKLIFVISIFFVAFYLFFSGRIIDLLYHSAFADNPEHFAIASNLLKIESIMIVLMGLSQVFTSILQASDKSKYPLIALGVGGAIKVLFELLFVHSAIGIYAVSISNVLCFASACAINTIIALRIIKVKSELKRVIPKAVTLTISYITFLLLLTFVFPTGRWWLVLIGLFALVFYILFVKVLKLFDNNEKKVFNKLTTGN